MTKLGVGWRWRGGVGLALGLALTLLCVSGALAYGAAVPGATYSGVASDDANVTFTISSDGTIVNAYLIAGATDNQPGAHTCDFVAAGAPGYWEGAPINGDAFEYALGAAILFQGTFTGPQTATGTFRVDDVANGSNPDCDTGIVSWSASTTATPPGGTTGGTTPTGTTPTGTTPTGTTTTPPGVTSPPKPKVPTYPTFVSLKKKSAKWLSGSVKASNGGCIRDRTVYLMLGRRRVATARTNKRGAYLLPVAAGLRNQRVRAAVSARASRLVICAAGSSKFLTA